MSSLGTAKQRESIRSPSACSLIERWVDEVEILLIHTVLGKAQAFAEALEVDDFAGAQELDGIVDVRVVGQAQDVVIRHACLLLGGQILRQVGDQIALDGHGRRVPREARGRRRIDARRVVDEVGVKARGVDILLGEIARQLMDDGADHLQMPEFLRSQRSIGNVPMYQIRGQA